MDEPRTDIITEADLNLLLSERDREDPVLALIRAEEQESRESLDSQILAGLVSP